MMKTRAVIQILLPGALALALSSCATCPISKNLRKEAKPVTAAQISANPGAYTGTIVIWGGKIIKTVNDTNGAMVYALQVPLTRYERPLRDDEVGGRFMAQCHGFLDPEVFRRGSLITLAGEVTGTETLPLQKMQYTYPVIAVKEIHRWHLVRRHYSPWYWGSGWYGPEWGWGWYGGGYWGPDEEWEWERDGGGDRHWDRERDRTEHFSPEERH